MTLEGIFSSKWQKRRFILVSSSIILVCLVAIFAIAQYAPTSPIWNSVNDLFTSVVASGVFAIFAALYISHFFADPSINDKKTTILPQDIGEKLTSIASSASHYRIFVRTGRHFRAEILPLLEKKTQELRRPLKLDVILLDCTNEAICDKYSMYRRTSSFDKKTWSTEYVQKEIIATILALKRTTETHGSLIKTNLHLSSRLSTFRFEGSDENILVTREDPKDTASLLPCSHRDFAAHLTDFLWIQDDSIKVDVTKPLQDILRNNATLMSLSQLAEKSISSPSPYDR